MASKFMKKLDKYTGYAVAVVKALVALLTQVLTLFGLFGKVSSFIGSFFGKKRSRK